MLEELKTLWTDEEGATMVEYALMLALIAIVCIVAVKAIGDQASTKFNDASKAIKDGTVPAAP